MAKDPVVTYCGHLFCWSCLYLWLHVYSNKNECPVCKGEVQDADVIPIYGHGNSSGSKDQTTGKASESGVRIPPRPHGHRFESARQRSDREKSTFEI
uniref:E3 ubiquitin-protein ligase RMA n=1 Tax=Nelumbo nucifera TaxID=4432 RepID=A0A822Y002_NELNU|nr:TPA_asm: hypothetical protein HUJ06_026083 [Nelumbo nucifera]